MDNIVNEKDKCCGCGLCAIKCPKNAIEMREDEFGFIYPYINQDKCINCGICKKVCAYNNDPVENKFEKKVYGAVSKDDKILNSTASGGVFTSIATEFIKQNGVVFGCSLEKDNNKFIVKHIKVDNLDDLEKLKGSKYVQSDITNIFKEIKDCLKDNKKVLFSGTPCQVAAIKKFTNNPDNLFTIDIICHGVPSNKMFNDYIEYENKKKNIIIEDFKFRDKSKGWGMFYHYDYIDKKDNSNKRKIKPAYESSYFQMFLDSYTYRDNCYSCPYANDIRNSDITLGDFWGVEKEHFDYLSSNDLNVKRGISCIVVNSAKGNYIFSQMNDLLLFESTILKVKKHNGQLCYPSFKPFDRVIIFNNYKLNGYCEINKYYRKKNRFKRVLRGIWNNIPYHFRILLKSVINH